MILRVSSLTVNDSHSLIKKVIVLFFGDLDLFIFLLPSFPLLCHKERKSKGQTATCMTTLVKRMS